MTGEGKKYHGRKSVMKMFSMGGKAEKVDDINLDNSVITSLGKLKVMV